MSEARYLHSTLYRFDEEARTTVIRRFHEKLNDIAARIFVLECPGGNDHAGMGANADETLAMSIQKYVDDELEAAERAERMRTIDRFTESIIDDVNVEVDGFADFSASLETADLSSPQSSPAKTVILHLVHTEAKDPILRLFRLAELPPGMMRRVLVDSGEMKAKKLMNVGFAVRAARGEDRKFNGHVGAPVQRQANEETFLGLVSFPHLSGTAVLQEDAKPASVLVWKPKDAPNLKINQWQMGIGETDHFEETEEPAKIPRDAQKMLLTEDPALGRARVPKGVTMFPVDDVSETETEPVAPAKRTFRQLYHAQHDGDDESESEASDNASDSSSTSEADFPKTHNFNSLLARPSSGLEAPASSAILVPAAPQPALAKSEGTVSNGKTSHPEDDRQDSGIVLEQEFKSYGQSWANVDNVGLKANAISQAQWSLEHPAPQRTTKRTTQLIPTSACLIMSPGGPTRLARTPSSSRLSSTQTSVHGIPGGHSSDIRPHWENKVVPNSVAEGRLVDDFALVKSSTPKYPPGLPQPRIALVRQALDSSQRSRSAQAGGILIDVPTERAASIEPLASRRFGNRVRRILALNPGTVETHRDDAQEHEIVERLGKQDEAPIKKYTMGQKARRKGKSKHNVPPNGSIKINAQLDLPYPAPPPKHMSSTPADKRAAAQTIKGKAKESLPAARTTAPASLPPRQPTPEPIPAPPVAKIAKMVEATQAAHPSAKLNVVCEFGLILTTFSSQPSNRKLPVTRENRQLHGVSAEVFLPRLTASTSDAMHILGAASQGAVSPRSYYKFLFKDLSGTIKWLMCDGDLCTVTECSADPFTTAYVHYPYRVWDTKWTVNAAPTGADLSVVGAFVASMNTIEEAPSFSARTPATFNVEQVFAVSEYSVITGDVKVIVAESRALKLESRQAKGNTDPNLKAMQMGTREELIADGRLWWEARIEADENDAEAMGQVVDRLICEMDGVGYDNVGPWDGADVQEAASLPEIPYW